MPRRLALLCFFLTGLTSLVFEVVWIQRAALAFGSTNLAVTTVVALFLGGLALGNWWFAPVARHSERPLRLFGWLAIGVGLLAMATLPLFGLAETLYGRMYRAVAAGVSLPAIRAALTALVLLPAVTLMGGYLPSMCRWFVTRADRVGKQVGFAYGLVTLGAAAGAALTGFWLLPALGMRAAVLIGAVLNITTGLVVLALTRTEPAAAARPTGTPAERIGQELTGPIVDRTVVAALFFIAGLVAVGAEIVWVRFLALLVPNSILTYTIALTAVLAGIALGSWLIALLAEGKLARGFAFGIVQLLGVLAILAPLSLPAISWQRLGIGFAPFGLLLPATILTGALLPIACRLVCSDPELAAERVGRLVALNTAGGIVGALVIGFWAVPHAGLAVAAGLLTGLGVANGVAALLLLRTERPRWLAYGVAAASVLAWLLLVRSLDQRLPHDILAVGGQLVDHAPGQTGTVSVVRVGDVTQLQIDRIEQGRDKKSHRIVAAHVPMIIHPAPRSVVVVGLGAGQTASRFLYYDIERLDCVEIEPAVRPMVARHFGGGWQDDPRVQFFAADGREFLAHQTRQYDVIALDLGRLPQPGVEAFYTLEFYRQARERLQPGGLLVQSLPIALLDGADFASVVATFAAAFPVCSLWYNATEPLLIGTNAAEFRIEPERLALLENNHQVFADLAYHQYGGTERWLYQRDSFLAAFLCGPEELARIAADAPLLHDDRPTLAYRASGVRAEDMNELELIDLIGDNRTKVDKILAEPLPAASVGMVTTYQKHNTLDIGTAAHLRRAQALQLRQGGSISREVFAEISAGLRLNPLSVPGIRAMGDALRLAGHPDRSEVPYRRVIELDPYDGFAHLGLGTAYFQQQDMTAALPLLERAVELRPDDPVAQNLLGATLAELGRMDEAVVHFREALRLDPNDPAARRNLERGLQILRQQQQAQPPSTVDDSP